MMTTDPAPSGAAEAGTHRPGRPAEQVIADAISSVLVVPAETLAPLAERVADALGLPWPSGAGAAGPVLGEEDAALLREIMHVMDPANWHGRKPEPFFIAAAIRTRVIAPLVAAAEERGAAAERERIAKYVEGQSCCGAPSLCGATCQDSADADAIARGAKPIAGLIRTWKTLDQVLKDGAP